MISNGTALEYQVLGVRQDPQKHLRITIPKKVATISLKSRLKR